MGKSTGTNEVHSWPVIITDDPNEWVGGSGWWRNVTISGNQVKRGQC